MTRPGSLRGGPATSCAPVPQPARDRVDQLAAAPEHGGLLWAGAARGGAGRVICPDCRPPCPGCDLTGNCTCGDECPCIVCLIERETQVNP